VPAIVAFVTWDEKLNTALTMQATIIIEMEEDTFIMGVLALVLVLGQEIADLIFCAFVFKVQSKICFLIFNYKSAPPALQSRRQERANMAGRCFLSQQEHWC
jgi:hypothetical protein